MTDEKPSTPPPNPGLLADIPTLLRGIVDRFIELGQARMELATAEIRAEVEQRIKRLILVVVPVCLILTALGLVNLGLVAWLAEAMGPVAASFLLAGIYAIIGIIWLLIWNATGGLNPPDPKAQAGQPGAPGTSHASTHAPHNPAAGAPRP